MTEFLAHIARLGVVDEPGVPSSRGADKPEPSQGPIVPRETPPTWGPAIFEPPLAPSPPAGMATAKDGTVSRFAEADDPFVPGIRGDVAEHPAVARRPDLRTEPSRLYDPSQPPPATVPLTPSAAPDAARAGEPQDQSLDRATPLSAPAATTGPAEPLRTPVRPASRSAPMPSDAAVDTRNEAVPARAPITAAAHLAHTAQGRGRDPEVIEPAAVAKVEPQPVPALILPSASNPRPASEGSGVEVRIGRLEIEVRQPRERRMDAAAPAPQRVDAFAGIAAARRLQDRRWY